jgi:hypothetical protein
LPRLRAITDKRKENTEKIYKKYGLDTIKEVFKIANDSSFLTGDNDRNWKANFDFIMREDKFVAILEGKYSGKSKKQIKREQKFADEGLAVDYAKRDKERERIRKEIQANVKRKVY